MAGGPKKAGNHYAVLGVSRDAEADVIKKAYRKLAREFHPDVAGDDPQSAQRFRQVQEAYEVLKDPTSRRRYDRRSQPRRPRMGPEGYRMPGGLHFRTAGHPGGSRLNRERFRAEANKMGLDDLVGDFGFGDSPRPKAGGGAPGASGGGGEDFWRAGEAGRRAGKSTGGTRSNEGNLQAGGDVLMEVDVPSSVAVSGGSVELRYPRLRAADDGKSIHRYPEITHLRVPPGSSSGDVLRSHRWGHAGPSGSCGDLVCTIRVVADASGRRAAPRARVRPGPEPSARTDAAVRPLSISLAEAVLGGRAEVVLEGKVLRVTIPPLSSGGRRLRLRGKGPGGSDVFFELRIVIPSEIDGESRDLIERFAELNPGDPREA